MKSLFDYPLLVNEVFYRGSHILSWIEEHNEASTLDKQALQAPIMDALVYKNLIDPEKESLDLEHLCIHENLDHYTYEKYPNVVGIPLWMKEEFRRVRLKVSDGIPLSIYLARPTMKNKTARYCIYDMNTAVSALFETATFYDVFYISPTRGIKIEEQRPFVEVDLGEGVLYLVDTLTKRIFKNSFFREKYGFEILSMDKIKEYQGLKKEMYEDFVTPKTEFYYLIPFLNMMANSKMESNAEFCYELEKSKEYFPEEWEKYQIEQELYFKRTI